MVGLQINQTKTKTLRINQKSNTEVNINNKTIANVEEFSYLGAKLSTQGGTDDDIEERIVKARNCFKSLNKIWRSSNMTLKIKINLYRSLVRSVLLYGSETWKLTMKQTKRLDVFQNKCLRIIMRIFWPNTMSNDTLLRKTNLTSINEVIKMRRWRFTGHILRMDTNEIPHVALTWAPEGSRRRGRPRLTWRRMMEKERDEAGWASWPEARDSALDRRRWKTRLKALCAPGH
ncbi:endonuclease-reverse transcriptase [Lasius niger]|uniref:Endonuclease-reverse transcriptase n=1 Tax=Lasius niger TaxID=67767 RepID=A0A0J7JWP8_LASNI|nr:endonuclease-reverse transcriptase [Lasius niger]